MLQRTSAILRMSPPDPTQRGLLQASGSSVPSGVAGYAKGCLFIDEAAGIAYINKGSVDSCTFKAITTAN